MGCIWGHLWEHGNTHGSSWPREAPVRIPAKGAGLGEQEQAEPGTLDLEGKESAGPILKEREPNLVSFLLCSSLKEAIKIVGRCASCLGNFQRIACNMIGT